MTTEKMTVWEVQRLLYAGQFETLERHFGDLLRQFQNGEIGDFALDDGLSALVVARRDLDAPLANWLKTYPESYPAHVAICNHALRMGWYARGTAPSNQTTPLQFKTMQERFDQAQHYLQRGMSLFAHPVAVVAVGMHMQSASADEGFDYHAEAERYYPRSPSLCEMRLWSLQPKWGGDRQALAEFYQACRQHGWSADDYRRFSIYWHIIEADVQSCEGNGSAAFQTLLKVEQDAQDNSYFLRTLGDHHLRRDAFPAAARCFERALALRPSPEAYMGLASAWEAMDEPQKRRQALQQAAELGDGYAASLVAFLLRADLDGADADQARSVGETIALWCRLGMDQFNSNAMFQEGCRYQLGLGVATDVQRAFRVWEDAGAWGHTQAIENCMLAYWDGRYGLPQDYRKTRDLATQGAAVGSDFCTGSLGRMMFTGQGGPMDRAAALPYLRHGAQTGDTRAMAELIRALWFGRGTQANLPAAQQWLERLKALDPELQTGLRRELSGLLAQAWRLYLAAHRLFGRRSDGT